MTRGELIEAVAEAWNSETADCSKPKCRTCSIAAAAVIGLVLEEAAKVADAASDRWHKEWRAGHKSSTHLEGKSDGADEIASAIRALKGRNE